MGFGFWVEAERGQLMCAGGGDWYCPVGNMKLPCEITTVPLCVWRV